MLWVVFFYLLLLIEKDFELIRIYPKLVSYEDLSGVEYIVTSKSYM